MRYPSLGERLASANKHTTDAGLIRLVIVLNKWISTNTKDQNITVTPSSDNTREQITHFSDNIGGYTYAVDSAPDSTFGISDTADVSLAEFFARPIKIRTFQWTPSVQLFNNFNPWSDFFNQSRVINRINNFNNLRAKLCVKFVVNGNGFYYGRALASYKPYLPNDDFTVDRAFFSQDLIAASQRPKIFLNPTDRKSVV